MNSPRSACCRLGKRGVSVGGRSGKILVLFAVVLPTLLAIASLVLDSGLMMLDSRRMQHVADSAATAAALELVDGGDLESAAISYVHDFNELPDTQVEVFYPPLRGSYVGLNDYVEVTLRRDHVVHFPRMSGDLDEPLIETRAVAGREPSTGGAAVVLLDPDPAAITLAPLPISLPSVTPLLGGLEVLGLGRLRVHGAIHVNNTWGGRDENGEQVGSASLLRHACSCTPLLPLTRVLATDVRVVGGVDDPDHYGPLQPGALAPLRANRRAVPDPYASLPPPTTANDSLNVIPTEHGGVTIVNLPPLQPPVVLRPGVYDWIEIVSGRVIFEPGIYVIRGVHPITQIGLSILTGTIRAEGVMFYLTNSASYSVASGLPDQLDGETPPASPGGLTLLPSAIIDAGLLDSRFSPLDSPGSPFDGLLIYQRRQDRRPILIVQQALLGNSQFAGNIYAKWSHVILAANGTYRSAIVAGSLRVATVLDSTIEPIELLPPAYDVYLVE